MKYRRLGRSNLQVSELCLGTMMFGDQTDEKESAAILDCCRAHGVNFVDTADVYTLGASEAILGRLMKADRHDWVLASKVGNAMSDGKNQVRYSRKWMLQELDASLVPAPRLPRHERRRGAARDRRRDPRRQGPLLGRVELPRLAHRRAGAPGP